MTASTGVRRTRSSALPENSAYQDTGCDLAPRCLECPLPQCRYDVVTPRVLHADRDAEIRWLWEYGTPVAQIIELIAGNFGQTLSRRRIYGIIKAEPS